MKTARPWRVSISGWKNCIRNSKKQPTALPEYVEQLIRRLIEKVTVYKNKFTVEFKQTGVIFRGLFAEHAILEIY